MAVEYRAFIAEKDYSAFKILVTTDLPRDYEMWLRVRQRGKLRAMWERAAEVADVPISPAEFGAYCRALRKPDFSIVGLDNCARQKAIAQGCGAAVLRAAS